jgi:FlaA1/EpsC-like NDP-sugar epimerase
VLFEHPNSPYAMEQELAQRFTNLAIAPVIGDVKDTVAIR